MYLTAVWAGVALPTGWNPKDSGEKAFHEALRAAGIKASDMHYTLVTGFLQVMAGILDCSLDELGVLVRQAQPSPINKHVYGLCKV